MPLPELAEWHLRSRRGDGDATRPDVLVAMLASNQWGIVDLDDLRRCGLTSKAVMARVRSGHLHPIHKRVYAVGHINLPQEARILASVKACGSGAYSSRRASGDLHGFIRLGDRRPDVLVLGDTTRRHEGIRVHRTSRLGPQDVTRCQGIRPRRPRGRSSPSPPTSPTRSCVARPARRRPCDWSRCRSSSRR